jgi:esterase/lipase
MAWLRPGRSAAISSSTTGVTRCSRPWLQFSLFKRLFASGLFAANTTCQNRRQVSRELRIATADCEFAMPKRRFEQFDENLQQALQTVDPPAEMSAHDVENARRLVVENWKTAMNFLNKEETLVKFAAALQIFVTNVNANSLLEEWKPIVHTLVNQQNRDRLGEKYVKSGCARALQTKQGKLRRDIKVTGDGKYQLLQWGGNEHNIAFRDFLKKMLDEAMKIMSYFEEYKAEYDEIHGLSKKVFMDTVATLVRETKCSEKSAIGQLRNADQKLYRSLTPWEGVKNQAQVIAKVHGGDQNDKCVAKPNPKTISSQGGPDFCLATDCPERSLEFGTVRPLPCRELIKYLQKRIGDHSTQSHKMRLGILRQDMNYLVASYKVPVARAATIVAQRESRERHLCTRDPSGHPVSEDRQARLFYDRAHDIAISKQLKPTKPSKKYGGNWKAKIVAGPALRRIKAAAPAHPRRKSLRSAGSA